MATGGGTALPAESQVVRHLPTRFPQFRVDAGKQIGELDVAPGAAGVDRGCQDDVARLAAVQIHEDGELIELGGGDLRVRAEMRLPEQPSLLGARQWKVDDEIEPPREGIVEARLAVAGQH